MDNNLDFTERQLHLANLQLQVENHGFLRILLANQVKIMDKLGVDVELPKSSYADIMPGTVSDDKGEMAIYIRMVELVSDLVKKRLWEWAKMNDQ